MPRIFLLQVWSGMKSTDRNRVLTEARHRDMGHPRGRFGRKSLRKLADFSLSSAEGEVKMYRMYSVVKKFGPKLLPEILKLSQNFSLSESSRMTPAMTKISILDCKTNMFLTLFILGLYHEVLNIHYPILYKLASVAQLDALSDWRPGGRGFSPCRGWQHSFV